MTLEEAIKLDDIETVEAMLIKLLEKEPRNVDLWFRLCMTEIRIPFADPVSAIRCIENIYEIEPDNVMATIIKAAIEYWNLILSKDSYERLQRIHGLPSEIMAIVYYLQALYFYQRDEEKGLVEYYIKKSISEYDRYPYVLKTLAMLNYDRGNYSEAVDLLKKALECVLHIFVYSKENIDDLSEDFTDYQYYIDELITGVTITDACYGFIEEWLKKAEEALDKSRRE